MPSETVLLRREGGIATLVLNRPDAMNSMNAEMMTALPQRLREVAYDASVRCVVLTGAGERAFSAGGDVKDMAERGPAAGGEGEVTAADAPAAMEAAIDRLVRSQEAALMIHEMPKPVVAAINGAVAGAALSLALACDLRIAVEGAAFTTAFARIGFSGDFGGSWWMTQIVGTAKARELYLLGERFDAAEAHRLGLVNRIAPRERFEAETRALATRLAEGPPLAHRYMKRNLNFAIRGDAPTALRLEAEAMIRTGASEDFKGAAVAFLRKETPRFRGR